MHSCVFHQVPTHSSLLNTAPSSTLLPPLHSSLSLSLSLPQLFNEAPNCLINKVAPTKQACMCVCLCLWHAKMLKLLPFCGLSLGLPLLFEVALLLDNSICVLIVWQIMEQLCFLLLALSTFSNFIKLNLSTLSARQFHFIYMYINYIYICVCATC